MNWIKAKIREWLEVPHHSYKKRTNEDQYMDDEIGRQLDQWNKEGGNGYTTS